jgi:Glycosyl transferase family 90
MGPIEFNKRRIFILVGALIAFFVVFHGLGPGDDGNSRLSNLPIPGRPKPVPHEPEFKDEDSSWDYPKHPLSPPPTPPRPSEHVEDPAQPPVQTVERFDAHPITQLMEEADHAFRVYEGSISSTFKQTVETYRSKYGRHPPPGFKEWYKFARKKNVFNIDDFEQVMDDLRPFWAVEPATIRIHAAHMWEDEGHGAGVIHIRDHKIVRTDFPMWRTDIMAEVINKFIKHLPDMDIAMNRLDQPRVVVPFEELQKMLQKELETRTIPPEVSDSFTSNLPDLLDMTVEDKADDNSTRLSAEWFNAPGQQYMKIASKACPPESPARQNMSDEHVSAMYKDRLSGIVSNFNLSSDLCTVGPAIQDKHGMLYAASSIIASHKLVPIFGECKVNINNDILFPANMYYKHDDRYDYDPTNDLDWRQKENNLIWRGVTSGGVQIADNWQTMHRQRLVQLFNGTQIWKDSREVNVLTQHFGETGQENITYDTYDHFQPSQFADQHSDIGFVESWGCVPDCSFYDEVFSWKDQTTLTSQFKSRYLIDVDGHSFSGRWHAFLQSKSLGLKATIFREWHDSRLFAWRHFVPVDNRYDDLYSLLTYFIGYGKPNVEHAMESEDLNPEVFIAPHDKEAQKLARQGRAWANKVLRRDDVEIYMFRLLLEYGRIIDDNRNFIGYSGDGSEMDEFDNGQAASAGWGFGKWWGNDAEIKNSTARFDDHAS